MYDRPFICSYGHNNISGSAIMANLHQAPVLTFVLHPIWSLTILAGLHLGGGGEGGPSPSLGTLLPHLELNSNILLYNIALLTAPPKS